MMAIRGKTVLPADDTKRVEWQFLLNGWMGCKFLQPPDEKTLRASTTGPSFKDFEGRPGLKSPICSSK